VALHLVNYASGERPATRAIPLGPLGLRVRLPRGFRPRSAELGLAGRKVRLAVNGGVARLVLPRLEEYELVVMR